MDLSDQHRRFLVMDQGVHTFAINTVLNGAIAWLILRGHEEVPLWGDAAMGPDLLATGVLLPLLMCQIVSRIIAKGVASGKIPPLEAQNISTRGMHRRSLLVRSLVLAVVATACASAPLVSLLHLANAQPVAFGSFVLFKALWAGLLAAMISPPMAFWAIAAASAAKAPAATVNT